MNKHDTEPELIDLYQKPEKIHPRSFQGRYRNLRLIGGTLLFTLFFATCWINIDGRQAVFFDLPSRQFHIFGTTFWPQDLVLLCWLLIICAFGLFTLTAFAGRIWCGYACPQSVFSWVFIWVERITEGERHQRMRLDRQPMSRAKLLRKTTKHLLWLGIAFLTALTFVGYFIPVRQLVTDIVTLNVTPWGIFWLGFFTLATYGNAGYLREQVCIYMCPYARFQSVMFDNDTLVVAYDDRRGEPRGKRRKDSDHPAQGLGDCIDCSICVQVCPTGIDIRNGLQYQCIGCAACIDACDTVMNKMGYAPGLVSYTTASELQQQKTRWLRPRLLGYCAALLVMIVVLIISLNQRAALELEVLRDRNVLFRVIDNDQVENVFVLKIVNKDHQPHYLQIQLTAPDGMTIASKTSIVVESGSVAQEVVRVTAPFDKDKPISQPVRFTLISSQLPPASAESRFVMPSGNSSYE